MHIVLAAATAMEIQPTVDFLLKCRNQPADAPKNHRVSILTTGVGALAAAWSLIRQIDMDRPDLIIQAGIAGSFGGKQTGEVLVVRGETLADLGVWESGRFQSVFDLRLASPDDAPFTNGRLVNPYTALLALSGLESVDAMTVNEITTDARRIVWLRQNTTAAIESMEGGALHYVGLREGIAFLQFRSVSNAIGVRDKAKWDIPVAIVQLNDRLIRFLQALDGYDRLILHPENQRIPC